MISSLYIFFIVEIVKSKEIWENLSPRGEIVLCTVLSTGSPDLNPCRYVLGTRATVPSSLAINNTVMLRIVAEYLFD